MEILNKLYSERAPVNRTVFDLKTIGRQNYGETGYESIEKMVNEYKEYFNDETVFYDLGCGIGKMVFHIGLKYNAKKSCGIEYSKERYDKAVEMKNGIDVNTDNIVFINDNFLDCDISDATFIYTDNTVFPKEVNEKLYLKIPNNCLVISRRQLCPDHKEHINTKFELLTKYGSKGTNIFIKKG